jgi:hypothetical protein
MDESCLSDSSGISEKLIFFDFVPFSLFPACLPRADDPRNFFIVSSPYGVRYEQHSAQTAFGKTQAPLLDTGVLQVFSVQTVRIKKCRGYFFE